MTTSKPLARYSAMRARSRAAAYAELHHPGDTTRDIVVAGIVLRVDGDRTLGPLREDTQDRRCAIDS